MIFTYYEVLSFKPRLIDGNTYHDTESLGFFSTVEKAEQKMHDWCDNKGICFEDHYYHVVRKYEPFKDDDYVGIISVAGLFFTYRDVPVKYEDDWEYASYAAVVEKQIVLDKDD